MEKIIIKNGVDDSTGLETQLEFQNLNLGSYTPFIDSSNVTLTCSKQYFKKDGINIHNQEFITLGILPDDSEETKEAKKIAIVAFETALKSPLAKLITALK